MSLYRSVLLFVLQSIAVGATKASFLQNGAERLDRLNQSLLSQKKNVLNLEKELRTWIEANGGFVHPDIEIFTVNSPFSDTPKKESGSPADTKATESAEQSYEGNVPVEELSSPSKTDKQLQITSGWTTSVKHGVDFVTQTVDSLKNPGSAAVTSYRGVRAY